MKKKHPIRSKHPYHSPSQKQNTAHLNNRSIQPTFGRLVGFLSILLFKKKLNNKQMVPTAGMKQPFLYFE